MGAKFLEASFLADIGSVILVLAAVLMVMRPADV